MRDDESQDRVIMVAGRVHPDYRGKNVASIMIPMRQRMVGEGSVVIGISNLNKKDQKRKQDGLIKILHIWVRSTWII